MNESHLHVAGVLENREIGCISTFCQREDSKMFLGKLTLIGVVFAFSTVTADAQASKGQKKFAVSYEECVAKPMKDGWSQPQASNYCANIRPSVRQ